MVGIIDRTNHGILSWSNHQIANAIRAEASDAYKRHVPPATQATLAETFDKITKYPAYRNEFMGMLVDKIAMQIVRDTMWANPLAKFKGPSLTYGASIEEIQVGLLEAYTKNDAIDTTADNIYKRQLPPIDVSYHTVNRYDVYKVTVPDAALRGAFINEGSLGKFAAALLDSPVKSDNRDEYEVMLNLFGEYEQRGGFFKVKVPDIRNLDSTPEQARSFLKTMRAWAGSLQFLDERFNAAKMPTAANPDDLELFITPQANAALDVDALAAMFNIDRGEVGTRTTLVNRIPIDGAVAVLTTRDFFVVADVIYQTDTMRNGADLSVNHFLHHKQIVSASRFVPAVVFTIHEGDELDVAPIITDDVSAITVTNLDGSALTPADTVQRSYQYNVDGYGVTEDEDVRTGTIFALTGNESEHTTLTQKGTLRVGFDEGATSITITQFAIDDPSLTTTKTLAVRGEIVVDWPNPRVEVDADNDGLPEVTPEVPVIDGSTATIPSVTNVQYRVDGNNVSNGTVVTGPAAITAVARPGYELAAGAPAGPWNVPAATS